MSDAKSWFAPVVFGDKAMTIYPMNHNESGGIEVVAREEYDELARRLAANKHWRSEFAMPALIAAYEQWKSADGSCRAPGMAWKAIDARGAIDEASPPQTTAGTKP